MDLQPLPIPSSNWRSRGPWKRALTRSAKRGQAARCLTPKRRPSTFLDIMQLPGPLPGHCSHIDLYSLSAFCTLFPAHFFVPCSSRTSFHSHQPSPFPIYHCARALLLHLALSIIFTMWKPEPCCIVGPSPWVQVGRPLASVIAVLQSRVVTSWPCACSCAAPGTWLAPPSLTFPRLAPASSLPRFTAPPRCSTTNYSPAKLILPSFDALLVPTRHTRPIVRFVNKFRLHRLSHLVNLSYRRRSFHLIFLAPARLPHNLFSLFCLLFKP